MIFGNAPTCVTPELLAWGRAALHATIEPLINAPTTARDD